MNLHEYQAKTLLTEYGVPVPRGGVAESAEAAERLARELGGSRWVVKAQIHAGDRGRAGGVRLVDSPEAVRQSAAKLLGRRLTTPQTGPGGMVVHRVLVEQAVEVAGERYLGVLVDRRQARVMIMASGEGGMDIEAVAARTPDKIRKLAVDPMAGLAAEAAHGVGEALGFQAVQLERAAEVARGAYRAFVELDASLIEVNPLALTAEGDIVALDVKMSLDDNALFRHRELAERTHAEDDPDRLERERHGFNYVKLDGNVGTLVTGAGLALATMDMIKHYAGEPANFLDLPPAARRLHVAAAFKHILNNSGAGAVLVNAVGGGMTRCDVIAEGIMTAAREVDVRVPVVVRFAGASTEMGLMLLRNARLGITFADDLADAARKAVQAARRAA